MGGELSQEAMEAVTGPVATRVCFVVDDDEGICRAMSFTLRKLGFEPREFAGAPAVEAAIGGETPALVFLDLGLRQSGALDVLPVLAAHGYRGPVQLMSGRSLHVMEEVLEAGAIQGLNMLPALAKPFRMSAVKDLVARLDAVRTAH